MRAPNVPMWMYCTVQFHDHDTGTAQFIIKILSNETNEWTQREKGKQVNQELILNDIKWAEKTKYEIM